MKSTSVNTKKIIAVLVLQFNIFIMQGLCSPNERPFIMVKNSQKQEIIEKIKKFDWAQKRYQKIVSEVEPFADRHRTDPEYILSRYQMIWKKPFYTGFVVNHSLQQIISRSGNGDWPTVRPPKHFRDNGYKWIGEIDRLVPYEPDGKQWVVSLDPAVKGYFFEELGSPSGGINNRINQLALSSAFLFWITGQEKYARLSADILTLVCRGLSQQVNGVQDGSTYTQCGLATWQTIEDATTYGYYLGLIYDFVAPWLAANHGKITTTLNPPDGPLTYTLGTNAYLYEAMRRLGQNFINLGNPDNNWNIVEAGGLVPSALAQENPAVRDSLLKYFLTEASANQKPIGPIMAKYNGDGLWIEPLSYHAYPTAPLLKAALYCENSGYELFSQYPKLYSMTSVVNRYLYPDGFGIGFGDGHGGTVRESIIDMEIALGFAEKRGDKSAAFLRASLQELVRTGSYKRDSGGIDLNSLSVLISGVPNLGNDQSGLTVPRTDKVNKETPEEYAIDSYLQRNGTDTRWGMMLALHGGQQPHGHDRGPSIELYGAGTLLGFDSGTSSSMYMSEEHLRYHRVWAAHNTVLVNEYSRRMNNDIWNPVLAVMEMRYSEPAVGTTALNAFCSFQEVFQDERSTGSDQRRTVALIRTSAKTGYYFDLFRSKVRVGGDVMHDYLYHNVGDSLTIAGAAGEALPLSTTTDLNTEDKWTNVNNKAGFNFGPGYSQLKSKYRSEILSNSVNALFVAPLETEKTEVRMKLHIKGEENRRVYTALSPRPWRNLGTKYTREKLQTPMLIVRQYGEAWLRPFAVVFEPYREVNEESLSSVTWPKVYPDNNLCTAMKAVTRRSFELVTPCEDIVLSSVSTTTRYTNSELAFKGVFGVIRRELGKLKFLYLGSGQEISVNEAALKSTTASQVSANLDFEGDQIYLSSRQDVRVTLSYIEKPGLPLSNASLYYRKNGTLREAGTIERDSTLNVIKGTIPEGSRLQLIVSEKGLAGNSFGTTDFYAKINNAVYRNKAEVNRKSSIFFHLSNQIGIAETDLFCLFNGNPVEISSLKPEVTHSEIVIFIKNENIATGEWKLYGRDKSGSSFEFVFNVDVSDKNNLVLYPNPFVPSGEDWLTADGSEFVNPAERNEGMQIVLVDMSGLEVYKSILKPEDNYRVRWSGFDDSNRRITRGIYFALLYDNLGRVLGTEKFIVN